MFVQKHNPNPRKGNPKQMSSDMKSELMFLSLGGSKFQFSVAECSALHGGETCGVEVKRTMMMVIMRASEFYGEICK